MKLGNKLNQAYRFKATVGIKLMVGLGLELRCVYSHLQYFFLSVRFWFVLLTLQSTHVFDKK